MADLRDVAEWIDGLERGVLAHQHSPQAGFTAFPDRLDQFDEDGNRVATLGRLPDGTFGVQPVAPVPPPSPTGPIVECDMNQVAVSWNGMFADEDGDGDPDVVEPSTLSHIAVFSRYLGTLDGPAGDDGEPSLVPVEGEPDVARGSIAYTAQAGGQLSFGPVVETGLHEVWLCAVGTDGGVSAPSERARFEVTYGLLQGELDEVRLRADGAMLSADGKNSVWRQDTAPVPSEEFPISDGDIWFHTGDSNMPHTWDGDKWVSVADERVAVLEGVTEQLGEDLRHVVESPSGATLTWDPAEPSGDGSDGDAWFQTRGNDVVAQWYFSGSGWVKTAITDSVIANLDAGKITTGFIDSARIQAGTVTADKLLVGDERNLIPNGDLRLGDATGWMDGGVFSSDAPAGLPGSVTYNSQSKHWHNMGDALFEQGDEIGFEVWLKADKPGSRIYVGIRNAAGDWLRGSWLGGGTISYPVNNADVPTEWTLLKASMVYEGPDSFKPSYSTWFFNHANGSIRDAAVSVAGVRLYKKTGSTYIADGAITTEKIAAGAITAESGVIGSLDLGKATVGQLNGDRILANSISAEHIRSGAVTATSLSADALNGKTITGATVQTSTGYPRVAMDKQGLHAWDQAGRKTFDVDQNTGAVELVGALQTGPEGTRRVRIDNRQFSNAVGMRFYPDDSAPTGYGEAAGITVTDATEGWTYGSMTLTTPARDGDFSTIQLNSPGVDYGGSISAKSTSAHLYLGLLTYLRRFTSGGRMASELTLNTDAGLSGHNTNVVARTGRTVLQAAQFIHNKFTTPDDEPLWGTIFQAPDASGQQRVFGIIGGDPADPDAFRVFGQSTHLRLRGENGATIDAGSDGGMGGKVEVASGVVLSGARWAMKSTSANLGQYDYEGTGSNWGVRYYKGGDWFGEIGAPGGMFDANAFGVKSAGSRELEMNGQGAHLRLRADASSPHVVSKTVYNRTYGNAANVYITSYGTLGRSTSARKHKLQERHIPADSYEDRLLSIPFTSWIDRGDWERWELFKAHMAENPGCPVGPELAECPQGEPRRAIGAVAEDFVDAGLSEFVTFDEMGEPDGLQYDRIGPALIPVVARQRDRISQLEGQLAGQAERLEALEASLAA